jgi:peptidoglycan-N-acetylglucosamine deacetylase
MHVNQVFFDGSGRRSVIVRRLFLIVIPVATVLLIAFGLRLPGKLELPHLLLPIQHRASHALTGQLSSAAAPTRPAKLLSVLPSTQRKPTRERGMRAAFYVTWDAPGYLSLRESLPQIDLLFPEWLHVFGGDGRVQAVAPLDRTFFDVIQNGQPQKVDNKVMPLLAETHAKTKVLPEVNNFDEVSQKWVPEVGKFMVNPAARDNFRRQVITFLRTDNYDGLVIDFENLPSPASGGYRELIKEVALDLHARGLKLYVAAPSNDKDYPYENVAANSDGVVLMNYDQHYPEGPPGPLAAQGWFTQNLQTVLKLVPREKLICGIGNDGYDWAFQQQPAARGKNQLKPLGARMISTQEAWEAAKKAKAVIDFDHATLNPHIAFVDEPNEQHQIWFTDATTAWNEMRTAQQLGINNFALWHIGSEDRSLWSVWDHPEDGAADKLLSVPPGHDIDYEGPGEVIALTAQPVYGRRTLTFDPANGLINGEEFQQLPKPYESQPVWRR